MHFSCIRGMFRKFIKKIQDTFCRGYYFDHIVHLFSTFQCSLHHYWIFAYSRHREMPPAVVAISCSLFEFLLIIKMMAGEESIQVWDSNVLMDTRLISCYNMAQHLISFFMIVCLKFVLEMYGICRERKDILKCLSHKLSNNQMNQVVICLKLVQNSCLLIHIILSFIEHSYPIPDDQFLNHP